MSKTEWKESTLGDLIRIKHGYAFKGDYITTNDNGVVLVTPGNFAIGGGFQERKCKFFSSDYPNDYVLKAGDLIVTMTDLSKDGDTLGYSAKVPSSKNRVYLHNQRIGLIEFKNKNADPNFLYWVMRSPSYQRGIVATASGSTVKHTSPGRICESKILLPPLAEQQRIAKILSSLDDKIELNNAINRNLEEQAQALFKNWFADFAPFGGKMPEDWKLGKLGDVAEIKKKTFHPEKNPGLIVEHYSLPALDEKYYPVFEVADGIKSNKFVVSKESVLISKLNPDTKRIWRPYCISENPICSTEFVVFESINGSHRDFLYSIIDSQQFYDFMGSLVTGCTNSHQRVSPETLLTFPIAIPPKTILKSFCDKITPIYEMIEKNVLENQRLANLRDSTLPKLMSGEIDSDKIAV